MSDFEDDHGALVTVDEAHTTAQEWLLEDVQRVGVLLALANHFPGNSQIWLLPVCVLAELIYRPMLHTCITTPTQPNRTTQNVPCAPVRPAKRRLDWPEQSRPAKMPNCPAASRSLMDRLMSPRQEHAKLLRQLLEEVGKQVDLFAPLTASCKPPSFGRPPHEDEDDAPGHGHGLFTPLGLPIM